MPNTIVKIDEIEDSIVHVMAFDENFLRDVHLDLRNLLPRFANILDNLCITILPEELDDIRQIFETIEREMETLSGKAYQKEILRGYTSIAIYKICAIFSRVSRCGKRHRSRQSEIGEKNTSVSLCATCSSIIAKNVHWVFMPLCCTLPPNI